MGSMHGDRHFVEYVSLYAVEPGRPCARATNSKVRFNGSSSCSRPVLPYSGHFRSEENDPMLHYRPPPNPSAPDPAQSFFIQRHRRFGCDGLQVLPPQQDGVKLVAARCFSTLFRVQALASPSNLGLKAMAAP